MSDGEDDASAHICDSEGELYKTLLTPRNLPDTCDGRMHLQRKVPTAISP